MISSNGVNTSDCCAIQRSGTCVHTVSCCHVDGSLKRTLLLRIDHKHTMSLFHKGSTQKNSQMMSLLLIHALFCAALCAAISLRSTTTAAAISGIDSKLHAVVVITSALRIHAYCLVTAVQSLFCNRTCNRSALLQCKQ
jgi:hypothetical protein